MNGTPEDKQEPRQEGLGLGPLAMRQVASAEADLPPEKISPKFWRRLLVVVGVVALAALVAWWVRVGSGIFVGQEEARALAARMEEKGARRYGILVGVELRRADTAVLQVAPGPELDRLARNPEVAAWASQIPVRVTGEAPSPQEERARLVKLAALEALEVFREVEPGRDLRVVLIQEGRQIGEGEHFRQDGPDVRRKGRVHLEEEGEAGTSRAGAARGE